MKVLTTFGRLQEFEAARAVLDGLDLPYEVLSPRPAYARVGVPCLVMEAETRMALAARAPQEFVCAGWVDYRPAPRPVPSVAAAAPAEDILGEVAVMVLAPCVADAHRIRLIAHVGGDLEPVLPYLNAEMPHAIYNPSVQALTYMDEYRMVTLYGRRITIAKADEIVDAWRVLDSVPPAGRRRAGPAAGLSSRATSSASGRRSSRSSSACPRPTAGPAASRRAWPLPPASTPATCR